MQIEVGRLANYFDGIQNVIEDICRNQCEIFVNTIKAGMDESISGQQAIMTSLSEMQAQVSAGTSFDSILTGNGLMRPKDLFVKLLTLRGHFAVINDNAQFYSQISRAHIRPAVDEVGRLPIDSISDDIRTRAADMLSERTMESARAIQDIGFKVIYHHFIEADANFFLITSHAENASYNAEPASRNKGDRGRFEAMRTLCRAPQGHRRRSGGSGDGGG